jgi:threonyl-tRNA synthetase
MRLPYILVVGEKEANDDVVSVRSRKDGELGTMKVADLIEKLKIELENKQ